jgi:hypothetical protein
MINYKKKNWFKKQRFRFIGFERTENTEAVFFRVNQINDQLS